MAANTQIVGRAETAPVPVNETTALISMIERAARDPSVDIEKLERLFQLQERATERRAKMAFDEALAIMQPQLPQVDRNGKIVVFSKADRDAGRTDGKPQQSTPYALWEDINSAIGPHLAEHGFALSFRTGTSPEGKITVTAVLSHKEGHREETTITLAHDSTGSKNSVQAVGSSISYGKRYTAGLLLNITSRVPGEADDDGRAAGGPQTISEQQRETLINRIIEVGADPVAFTAFCGVHTLDELPAKDFQQAMVALDAKAKARKDK